MGNGMNRDPYNLPVVAPVAQRLKPFLQDSPILHDFHFRALSMKKWIQLVETQLLPPGEPMTLILPGLYVGNYRDSKDSAQLNRNGITHIIAIHDAARKLHHDKHYLCVMASDTPDQNLSQYFSICNDFIHAARLRGGNVLIHCLAGMSRSVTVAVAYIMSVTDLSWKDALKVVRVGRSVANPNLGFQKQLQDFESLRLFEERRRLKERFPSLALLESDTNEIRLSLASYDALLESRDICEGSCGRGEACPTGMCRPSVPKKSLRRKSSTSSLKSTPSSPRQLPPTPGPINSCPWQMSYGGSTMSMNSVGRRPRSSPSGLHSYTTSCPPSRSSSRADISETLAEMVPLEKKQIHGRISSAPNTPLATPPTSPRWPRKTPSGGRPADERKCRLPDYSSLR